MLDGGPPLGWAVRTDDLDGVAGRLGLAVGEGSRATPTGGRLTWRIAGVEQSTAEPALPFFIQWGRGTVLPGRLDVRHRAGPASLTGVVVGADSGRLDGWLEGAPVPVDVEPGPPVLVRVLLATGYGGATIDADFPGSMLA